MMACDTGQRILEAALDLFAERGYDGTNLRDLAASLRLSKSALYRHFDSKEAIKDALFNQLEEYYADRFGSIESLLLAPSSMEQLRQLALGQVAFTMHDERIVKSRKVMAQEQFRDKRTAEMATLHLMSGLEDFYANVFAQMMESGVIRQDDPHLLALEFTAPVTSLVALSDREPDRCDEALARIETCIERFCKQHVA